MVHVKAVARLLIGQGVAELVVALSLMLGVRTLPVQTATQEKADFMAVYMFTLGLVILACAVMKVLGGARNLKMRNRGLGYVALASAVPTAFTCWCAPTGLAIMIYGLFAYSRVEGRAAFAHAEAQPAPSTLGLG